MNAICNNAEVEICSHSVKVNLSHFKSRILVHDEKQQSGPDSDSLNLAADNQNPQWQAAMTGEFNVLIKNVLGHSHISNLTLILSNANGCIMLMVL